MQDNDCMEHPCSINEYKNKVNCSIKDIDSIAQKYIIIDPNLKNIDDC